MSSRPAANRMTLATFKAKYVGAKKGHGLLKKKRDALKAKFQAMLKEIVDTKLQVGTGLKEAAFSLAKAQWANSGDDITATAVERAKRPSVTCKLQADNVAGVKLPSFRMTHDPTKDAALSTLGVAHGGAVIQACRETHLKVMGYIIKLASLQTSFMTLDMEIKMTSRRVNALEYVLIPRIEDTIAYINLEIDEQARDEFTRVKKVVEKKRQRIEREKAELEAQMTKAGVKPPPPMAAMDAPSALQAEKDPDLIF
eukprot:gnl/TRDRNA2_/TRDRNA2_179455_c0_seq1.p2 gnl/TRDRNA2_/TRDRNA2_179455_c0~~gnl/TRDRNA2_/TRDRNA2_179455_c0_seq1.p2  ORF type:complete len:255 (+),score=85.77 gnl/TRDRNA2_/TRDRNA2_179455_c0_seq1:76-840(+)